MLSGIGVTEAVLLGLVLLVMFGGKKLTELAKGMGEAVREVRRASR